MNITHDQSLIGYDSRELIKRGYGCMAIDVLRLEEWCSSTYQWYLRRQD